MFIWKRLFIHILFITKKKSARQKRLLFYTLIYLIKIKWYRRRAKSYLMVIKTKSLNEISAMANCKPINKQSALTVGENIFGAPKIRNDCGPIIHFSNNATAILAFSLFLNLMLHIIIFFVSSLVLVLCFFWWLSLKLSLLKAITKRFLLLFAIAFKSLVERKLLQSQ